MGDYTIIKNKRIRKAICDLMSEMLDNPDRNGIYPTSRFMSKMEDFVISEIQTLRSKVDRYEKALKRCKSSMKDAVRCHTNGWGEETMNCVANMDIDIKGINKALQDKE